MTTLKTLLNKFWGFIPDEDFNDHRLGSFWCDKHWQIIKDSQKEERPISPAVAAFGITSALHLKEVDPTYVRESGHACCILFNIAETTPIHKDKPEMIGGKKMLDGIFEKSRGW